mmetsp:Transcript_111610/g.193721  ORF Transcript_111610/g.193721 Transcript_111610/m.193721 type:complete len:356 (+) Transcript_111610:286-1353(+)
MRTTPRAFPETVTCRATRHAWTAAVQGCTEDRGPAWSPRAPYAMWARPSWLLVKAGLDVPRTDHGLHRVLDALIHLCERHPQVPGGGLVAEREPLLEHVLPVRVEGADPEQGRELGQPDDDGRPGHELHLVVREQPLHGALQVLDPAAGLGVDGDKALPGGRGTDQGLDMDDGDVPHIHVGPVVTWLLVAVQGLPDDDDRRFGMGLRQAWPKGDTRQHDREVVRRPLSHVVMDQPLGLCLGVAIGVAVLDGAPSVPVLLGEDSLVRLIHGLDSSNGACVHHSLDSCGLVQGLQDVIGPGDGWIHNLLLRIADVVDLHNSCGVDDAICTVERAIVRPFLCQVATEEGQRPLRQTLC